MANAMFNVPFPENEPILSYAPGSPERAELKAAYAQLKSKQIEIPLIIGGREVRTGKTSDCRMPHDHAHLLGTFHEAGAGEVELAIQASLKAHQTWSEMPWQHRVRIFLKAADLLAGPWRATINAATMLAQSKNPIQAEIDAACELIDFWRFNAFYLQQIYAEQPESQDGMWNVLEHRPLEGFIFAVTPFNFTSIGGNLPTAPAMMGNVALWKPASSAVYSNYFVMKLLEEAGLPAGVINFLPGSGAVVGDPVLASEHLAGIHFTGSTAVFKGMWKTIGDNIGNYRYYPRIVGETGGKDFVFAHPSADVDALVTALVRGAFEFQGQKCSAASRAFIPASIFDEVMDKLKATVSDLPMGDADDYRNFMCAVIDQKAFKSIKGYIDFARADKHHEIVVGGGCDDSKGWFIEPTVVVADQADCKLMVEEIFGPVLTVWKYEDDQINPALDACNTASDYALTGAIFSQDREAIVRMSDHLRHAAGNFYINDKPTGAVVGQQPFGGGRASGTNDKAGSVLNLVRWVSPRTIKETFVPAKDHRYPHMDEA